MYGENTLREAAGFFCPDRKSSLKNNANRLENMLAVSEKLRKAYWLNENFYKFMDSKDIYEAKKNLKNWNLCIGVAQLEEFKKCFDIVNKVAAIHT
jgi:hypothetical protein